MALQKIPGLPFVAIPDPWAFNGPAAPSGVPITLDASGEAYIACGRVLWADGGSHTISSAGGKIGWETSTGVVWGNGSSVFTIGLQDLSTSAGPAARGDGTFDVFATLTQGVETIASSTWYDTAMESGSKTLATGDTICIVAEFTTVGSGDQVTVERLSVNSVGNSPTSVNFLAGSYAGQGVSSPNFTLIADDGTYGTLMGSFPYKTGGTLVGVFNNGSATKEYGNLFKLPFACRIMGQYVGFSDAGTAAAAEFNLYTDPLNAGAGVTQVAAAPYPARSGRNVGTAWITYGVFSTPYDYLVPNTLMAMAARPTSANNVNLSYFEVNSNAAWACHPLGVDCYSVSRGTVGSSTPFATFGSTSRRMIMGLLLSHFGDEAGGGVVVPNITRNIFLGGEL